MKRREREVSFDSLLMKNDNDESEKKKTAVTNDEPQEEFIRPENVPSKSETDAEDPPKTTRPQSLPNE